LNWDTGITSVTLRTWQRDARAGGRVVPGEKHSGRWSSADKFRVVLQTASLSEAELAEYCRTHGVHREQIEQWRLACEGANGVAATRPVDESTKASASDMQDARKRIRELERELRRKDAALAETAALLVLRKKAEAIWGKGEED
jgi:transposase-like protein